MHIAFDVAVLVTSNTNNQSVLINSFSFYKRDMRVSYAVILGFAIFFNVLAVLFLGHLISFHLLLQREGKTTFEYILEKNNRKNQKSKIYRDVKTGDNNKDAEN